MREYRDEPKAPLTLAWTRAVTSIATRLPTALVTAAVAYRSARSPPALVHGVLAFLRFQVVSRASYDELTRYAESVRACALPPATVRVRIADVIGVPAGNGLCVSNFRTIRRTYVASLLARVLNTRSDERFVLA